MYIVILLFIIRRRKCT